MCEMANINYDLELFRIVCQALSLRLSKINHNKSEAQLDRHTKKKDEPSKKAPFSFTIYIRSDLY